MGRLPKWPMSAYSASPPVMTRTTAPSTRNPCPPFRTKNVAACTGLSAPSTAGSSRIPRAPRTAIATNQTSITGPNTAPTVAVPRFWNRNSSTRIATDAGTTA